MYAEELLPLREHFDAVLVRADGLTVCALCLKSVADSGPLQDLERDDLLAIGDRCLEFTGSINRAKLPETFDIVELHEHGFSDEDTERLGRLSRSMPGARKVAIGCWALGFSSQQVWGSHPLAPLTRGRYFRRIVAGSHVPEHELIAAVARAGVSPIATVGWAVLGVIVALVARYPLVGVGVEDGRLFGSVDVFVGMMAAVGGVFGRRIRVNSAAQGGAVATLYCVLLCGAMLLLGASPSVWMALNAAVTICLAAWLGSMAELT